jgi:hypothetical protein
MFVPTAFIHDTSNLAYVVLNAPVLQEFPHIRASLEHVEGCAPFTSAASAFGSAMLIFQTLEERERAIGMGPFIHDGITTSIVRPEEAEYRS